MMLNLTDEEAVVTIDALRLRSSILEHHLPGFKSLPLYNGWLVETIAHLDAVANRIEAAKEAEWADIKASYDAMQTQDMSESEIRALYGDR